MYWMVICFNTVVLGSRGNTVYANNNIMIYVVINSICCVSKLPLVFCILFCDLIVCLEQGTYYKPKFVMRDRILHNYAQQVALNKSAT